MPANPQPGTQPDPHRRHLIGVIEDEEHIAGALLFNLEAEGFATHHEADGDAAMAWLTRVTAGDAEGDEAPAALLLDVMLPGRDGFSIVRELRARGVHLPVLLLTARGRTEDVVQGFEAGADDYLAKPFDLSVLFARLQALLRRVHWQQAAAASSQPAATAGEPAASADSYTYANGHIDFDALELHSTGGGTVRLTLMEADLLRYLAEHPGEIVSRKQLLEHVWRVREDTDTRAIDNFIVRLRRYMEPFPSSPVHLLTVRGVGYRFVPFPA